MKRLLLFLFALSLPLILGAGNEPITTVTPPAVTLPDSNVSSFRTDSRNFWQNELPSILRRYFPSGFIVSGGVHGTSTTCTSSPFSLDAFTSSSSDFTSGGNHIGASSNGSGGSKSIDYSVAGANCTNPGSDLVHVMACAIAGSTTGSWARYTGTNYFTSLAASPSTPADCIKLMDVTILNGAISGVTTASRKEPVTDLVGTYNVTKYGVLGDGVTDVATPLAALVRQLCPTGGFTLFFPPGTYITSGTAALLSITDCDAVTIQGSGIGATVLQVSGTGHGISLLGTTQMKNTVIRDLSILYSGSSTTPMGIDSKNLKDDNFERISISGFKNNAINYRGVDNLNHRISDSRLTAGSSPIAGSSAVKFSDNTGQVFSSFRNYYNIGGNPLTGGSGYTTALNMSFVDTWTSFGDIFNGSRYAINSNTPGTVIQPYFDSTSVAPIALTCGILHESTAPLQIIGSRTGGSAIGSPTLLGTNFDVCAGSSVTNKKLTYLGGSDIEHSGVIAGMLVGSRIAPAQIAGTMDDYAPTVDGAGTAIDSMRALIWDLNSDIERIITGMAAGVDGQVRWLHNTGTPTIILRHEDSGSTSSNQYATWDTRNTQIRSTEYMPFLYSAINSKWNQLAPSPSLPLPADVYTATQITSNQNNYNAGGDTLLRGVHVLRISSDATRTITGIDWTVFDPHSAGRPGYFLTLINVGSFDILVTEQDGLSFADRRVITGVGTVTISSNRTLTIMYDAASTVWRTTARN